jgi:YD repeat-containing protein
MYQNSGNLVANKIGCFAFVLMGLFFSHGLYSQILNSTNVAIPPSPNASALLEYVNVPVDHYTGVPDINVPLYTLPGRDIKIPVGVSYHASGIKVQDVASSVGLGWNLYGGGAITRVVRGKPDGSMINCALGIGNPRYWSGFTQGTCDHESDIFYFNFLGQTGKFFLDEGLVPYQIPQGYSKILPMENGKIVPSVPIDNQGNLVVGNTTPKSRWSWLIIDENGYQYFFGENVFSTETSTVYKTYGTLKFPGESFLSTWYLTKVISPKGVEVATFTYTKGQTTEIEYFSSVRSTIVKTSGDCQNVTSETEKSTNTKVTINDPTYPAGIVTSLGSVYFYFEEGRRDIAGKYLNYIEVRDINYAPLKRYFFQYGYFTGTNARIIYDPSNGNFLGCGQSECALRLKLASITDDSSVKIREFVYNELVDLPQRASNYIDHWGYYNYTVGNYPPSVWQSQTRIPRLDFRDPSLVVNGSSSAGLTVYSGAIKSAVASMAAANILTQIKYPTGGFTIFEYEGNQTVDGMGGGLRIKSIKDYKEPTALVGQRTYTYEQGKKYRDPVYHYLIVGGDFGQDCFFLPFICWSTGCRVTKLVRNSSTLNEMFDINGVSVGYGKVTETQLDNSKIERYYSNFDTNPDTEPAVNLYQGNFSSYQEQTTIPRDSYGPPFAPKTSNSWERGLMTSEKIYDSSPRLLSETQYNYDFSLSSSKQILCKSIESTSQMSSGSSTSNILRVGTYYVNIKPINLLNTSTTVYSQIPISGSSPPIYPSVTSTSVVTKHPVYQNYAQSIVTSLADGAQTKVEYRYVFDLTNGITTVTGPDTRAQGFLTLINQNAISSPVEVITYYKKPGAGEAFKVIGAQLKTFSTYAGSKALPYEEWSLEVNSPLTDFVTSSISNSPFTTFSKDSRYRLINTYTYGNSDLTLNRMDPSSGVASSYEWGFNNTLVTATNVNPGTSQIRTEYTQIPLIGVTSIKDANNQTVNYEYDKYQRLKLIKDIDGNILQRYRYHYQNQSEFTVDFQFSGNLVAGQGLTFQSSSDLESIGSTSYLWDFGDGNVIDGGNSKYAYKIFNNPGTYIVKLSKVNPEYGSITVQKQIVIQPPPSVSISASRTSVDLCTTYYSNLTATATGGCSNTGYTYQWYYQSGGTWYAYDTSPTTQFSMTPGTYQVKCVIKDSCGVYSPDSNIITISFYKSSPNCPIN